MILLVPGLNLYWKSLLESCALISFSKSPYPRGNEKPEQTAKQWSEVLVLAFVVRYKACHVVNQLAATLAYVFLFLPKCYSNIVLNSWT